MDSIRLADNQLYRENQRKLSKYQAEHRTNPTRAEAMVRDALDRLGARYVFQKGFLRQKTMRLVDFYFPSPARICLEVDGDYHDAQADYDRYREGQIKKQRVNEPTFIRVKNEWVFQQADLEQSLRDLLPEACFRSHKRVDRG